MSRSTMKQHRMMWEPCSHVLKLNHRRQEGKEQSCVDFFQEPSGRTFLILFSGFFLGDYLFLYDEIWNLMISMLPLSFSQAEGLDLISRNPVFLPRWLKWMSNFLLGYVLNETSRNECWYFLFTGLLSSVFSREGWLISKIIFISHQKNM